MSAPHLADDSYSVSRQHHRTPCRDSLGIPVTITQFGKLHRHDITVYGTDLSEGGIGIIADVPIASGFVWFWRRVGTQTCGMVVWSREINGHYRAGIQFLHIPMSVENLTDTSD